MSHAPRVSLYRWCGFLLVCGAFVPTGANAQAAPRTVSDSAMQQRSQQLIAQLQTIRPLVIRPAPLSVVSATRVDGRVVQVPPTAALGLADADVLVGEFDESLFAISVSPYPADSVKDLERTRAQLWSNRLQALPPAQASAAIGEWQRVSLARLAALSENDTLARRLFDARLAEVAQRPTDLAYTLFEAVATFAKPDQDSTRLARNMVLAEQYMRSLLQVRVADGRPRHDHNAVLYHQYYAEDSLLSAYSTLGNSSVLFARGLALLRCSPLLANPNDPSDRVLTHVMNDLSRTKEGRAQLHAFWPSFITAIDAVTPKRVEVIQEVIQRIEKQWALLNTPAPTIAAHAWLNTPDSLYSPTPIRRGFADGHVHVVAYGYPGLIAMLSMLDRLHPRFGPEVEALFVMERSGLAGPDLADAKTETAYYTRFFRGLRHFTTPIAIWAGPWTGSFETGNHRVESSPNVDLVNGDSCVVIDGTGQIRYMEPLKTRRDEMRLVKNIELLLRERRLATGDSTRARSNP